MDCIAQPLLNDINMSFSVAALIGFSYLYSGAPIASRNRSITVAALIGFSYLYSGAPMASSMKSCII